MITTATKTGLGKRQEKWRTAYRRLCALRFALEARYGHVWHAPRGQEAKLDHLREKETEAADAVFAWLDEHSPRCWRTGPPMHWVCGELTEADALTSGPLSVVPPPAYGSAHREMDRFAAPVA